MGFSIHCIFARDSFIHFHLFVIAYSSTCTALQLSQGFCVSQYGFCNTGPTYCNSLSLFASSCTGVAATLVPPSLPPVTLPPTVITVAPTVGLPTGGAPLSQIPSGVTGPTNMVTHPPTSSIPTIPLILANETNGIPPSNILPPSTDPNATYQVAQSNQINHRNPLDAIGGIGVLIAILIALLALITFSIVLYYYNRRINKSLQLNTLNSHPKMNVIEPITTNTNQLQKQQEDLNIKGEIQRPLDLSSKDKIDVVIE